MFVIKYSIESLMRSLRFSIPNTPKSIIGLLQESIDKLMLANIKAINILGNYQVGVNIGKSNNTFIKYTFCTNDI